MMMPWNPDPKVLQLLEREIQKTSPKDRIATGRKVMTWNEVLDEVREGTDFGKRYYQAFLESMQAGQ